MEHLPALLEIHGDADRNVPLAKGEELVALAKRLGAPAELVSYPGRTHGFDFSDTDPMTSDAIGRVVQFFQMRLDRNPRYGLNASARSNTKTPPAGATGGAEQDGRP